MIKGLIETIATQVLASEFNEMLIKDNISHIVINSTPNLLDIGYYQVFLPILGITVNYYNGTFSNLKLDEE
jgi:hypothetical protein